MIFSTQTIFSPTARILSQKPWNQTCSEKKSGFMGWRWHTVGWKEKQLLGSQPVFVFVFEFVFVFVFVFAFVFVFEFVFEFVFVLCGIRGESSVGWPAGFIFEFCLLQSVFESVFCI